MTTKSTAVVADRFLKASQQKTASMDLYDDAFKVARQGYRDIVGKLSDLMEQAESLMAQHDWVMDKASSDIDLSNRMGNDGKWLQGQLVFEYKDKDAYLDSREVEALFEKETGLNGHYYQNSKSWKYEFE